MKNKETKSRLKKITAIAAVSLAVLYIFGGGALSYLIYSEPFGRVGYSQDRTGFVPNLTYSDADQAKYPREKFTFSVSGNQLTGYAHGQDNTRGLIVISSGLGGGGDDYTPLVTRFVDDGYRVITYDNTGVASSEGNGTRGLAQSAIDLDALLTHIEGQSKYDSLPIYLIGHSWGGYGVCAALVHPHRVKAVVSMAGYNNCAETFTMWGEESVGGAFYLLYPHLWLIQKSYFGASLNVTAVDVINANDIPFLIIQGKNDDLVKADTVAIYCYKNEITNPKAQFMLTEGDHEWVYCSKAALSYHEQLREGYNEYKAEYEKNNDGNVTYMSEWIKSVDFDKELYNQADEALILKIEALFDSTK